MKLSTQKRDVVKSENFETVNYGVSTENLVLLFKTLRTNLYSDLYGSIIREIVSNVVDSHTEAKKADAVGEVEWVEENRLLGVDSQLIIRDFGVGLSPQRMKEIYGNYFSSTKREDNTAIGGFGLGSKVPFAYTDSFHIKTVFDGTEYQYLCYIDSSELGAISLLNQKQVNKENGTEIILPIKNKWDKEKFQMAIFKQLSYFQNIKYIGFNPPDNKVVYEDEHCILIKRAPYSNIHIVLGQVAYDINFGTAGIDPWNDAAQNCYVGLKFNIGDLQPTMSREEIFWDEGTKKKVRAKMEAARRSIRVQIEKELSAQKDYAKWYTSVTTKKTETFPAQWEFSKVKTDALFQPADGSKPLKVTGVLGEWFAGHNVRTVTPWSGYRRRSSAVKKDPEYSTSPSTTYNLQELPIFRLDSNLSARKCLFLFKKHPEGFIAINHIGLEDATKVKELAPYYNQAKKWVSGLPNYDEIEVPDGEFEVTSEDDYKEQYRKLVKQRKLEGKFTSKRLRKADSYSSKLEDSFEYNMFESKFEDHKKDLIVYGLQEDSMDLFKTASILMRAKEFGGDYEIKGITYLKIGQQYLKQFDQMPNAYYVKDVLALKTPLNEKFANIVTAGKYEEQIDQYKILKEFSKIEPEMKKKFDMLKQFILDNTSYRKWQSPEVYRDFVKFCTENDILNSEMTEAYEDIEEYFKGAELVKFVQFTPQSEPYIKAYLKWVKGNVPAKEVVHHKFPEEEVLQVAEV